jgi:multicomponent Na+:H+ antiporter subunit G
MTLVDIISLLLFLNGLFFLIVGTIGLLRLPDLYTRTHATTKCDTLGAVSILIGLAIYSGDIFTGLKMVSITIFIFIANPTAAHVIAKAAYLSGEVNQDAMMEIKGAVK